MAAAFVPPPVLKMNECLGEWEKFLHMRDAIPDLIQCAMMHAQVRGKPNALGWIDDLFINTCMTIGRAAKILGETHPTAKATIAALERSEILREITGRQWGRSMSVSQSLMRSTSHSRSTWKGQRATPHIRQPFDLLVGPAGLEPATNRL